MLISRSALRELLPMRDCIAAVEAAFGAPVSATIPAGVLGSHAADGGFHVKTAGLLSGSPYFAAKINANFPMNPSRTGRPTIQGILVLHDATNGDPLAVMDSAEITRLRTAAATAVAAKYLSKVDAATVTICGCGSQAAAQLEALRVVRPITRAFVHDIDAERARTFSATVTDALRIDVVPVSGVANGSKQSDVIITCTPSTRPILGPDDVVDDLQHAIVAGVMTAGDVRAELGDVVSGSARWSRADHETVVFDSTGTALEDVAAAAVVYERARARGLGTTFDFTG